ncbi:MAG: cyclic nucleotide-binding domain-containing protein [Giesbergeria sp.]|nr:cyclic nucleotide-binding domain-containing protein [Giesbergeria sp.]MBP8091388.1 cyclic nucleotide-binding domain-containing protein [Giesbergeria sp.]
MKGILGLLRRAAPGTRAQEGASDSSAFFSSAFAQHDAGNAPLVPWEARAVEIGAEALSPRRGSALLQQLWSKDKYMAQLGEAGLCRLEPFFAFARLGSNRDLVRQNEYGNFMVVLLSGAVSIDRLQTWGEVLRLAEAHPGDILGEMSLLDSGNRLSSCTTLGPCSVAVLSAEALDEMVTKDPALAANLVALLARKLSLRLRAVSARLSQRPN